ncbi:hypothetical protein D3C85_1665930 [compost metagenome]
MEPCKPAPELVLIIRASTLAPPLACSRQYFTAWLEMQKWPLRCTATTASQSASLRLANMRSRQMPALLTTTFRSPKVSMAWRTISPAES